MHAGIIAAASGSGGGSSLPYLATITFPENNATTGSDFLVAFADNLDTVTITSPANNEQTTSEVTITFNATKVN